MDFANVSFKVEFKNSKERKIVSLALLSNRFIHFLEHYGEESVVGKSFYSMLGEGNGETKFNRLLEAANYKEDPRGFFQEIIQELETANSYDTHPIQINNITLPNILVYSILEILIPGNKFIKIKNVEQLEKLTNTRIPEEERSDLQHVIELFPVRLSHHTIRQMRVSPAIAYQYMPFVDELNEDGAIHTWVGQFHRGIVEQMYENRIIFILNMACPVYCRFCFRKHKECRNQRSPQKTHVQNAINYVKAATDVKEIVLTGGDPFMNKTTLTYAVSGLSEIPHVQTLRVATRSISYYPHLFYANQSFWLNYLKRISLELESKGKRIEVATHFIHPDEVSIDSIDIITELVQNGISVYVQTPLLSNCNDRGPELTDLYNKMRGAGAEMHYIYIPCSTIKGNRVYVTPISTGIQLASYLRANLSDRAMPRICTATKIGKIDWNQSGWAVEVDEEDSRYIWIRTPYTQEYFSKFAPILQLQEFARVNPEGTLDAKFMVDVGDEKLLWGNREPKAVQTLFPPDQELTESNGDRSKESLIQLQAFAVADQRLQQSIVPTGSNSLFRIHKTRVELDLDAESEEMKKNIDMITADDRITDVVISRKGDVMNSIYDLKELIHELEDCSHINAIRLRSLKFNYDPQIYSLAVINRLGKLNNLSIVNPRRLEIETQFLHSSEITAQHKEIATNLRKKGITIYNNTPLLSYINDSEEEILQLAYKCRQNGIEFHHLYIAGLPIQSQWSEEYPLEIEALLDIATVIRRNESGRSIPRFIIRTSLGEVDFGLTSEVMETDEEGRVYLKLLPYTIDYYRSLYPEFDWHEDIKTDAAGHPVILIPALKRTPEFLFE